MLSVTLAVIVFFVLAQIMAQAEDPSYYSGTNFLITAIMIIIVTTLLSFTTLSTSINEDNIRIKFGYGIFTKKFPLSEIASVQIVKNHWYYGWGIRLWLWPKMWIYNVSGFDAVQITMKNGNVYRIGTDVPLELESAIKTALK